MTTSPEAVSSASKRRRRWPWVVLVITVLLVALIAAGEVIARALVPAVAREKVIAALSLPADQEITVQTSGMLVPQLLAGRLDSVRLAADSVALGTLVADVDVTATGVLLDGGEMAGATGVARISDEAFREVLAASDLPLDEVTLEDGAVSLAGSVRVFGLAIALAVRAAPAVDDRALTLRPVAFRIGGAEVDAQELARRLGPVGEALAGPYPVCVADRMPAGLSLTSLTVSGGEAVVGFDVDGRIAVDAALQRPGSCD